MDYKEMPFLFELDSIKAYLNYQECTVSVCQYVEAKTKELQGFGYNSLTENEVLNSVWRCHSRQIQKSNVIDQFVKDEILPNTTTL